MSGALAWFGLVLTGAVTSVGLSGSRSRWAGLVVPTRHAAVVRGTRCRPGSASTLTRAREGAVPTRGVFAVGAATGGAAPEGTRDAAPPRVAGWDGVGRARASSRGSP